jgi:CDP-diacylglycerol--glycerol-3-phosphate 3-phosphatidyltransferase
MWPQGPFLTVPNLLSLSRLAVLPLFLWSVGRPGYLWLTIGLVAYGIVSDLLDGYLARRLGQESEWGRLLDPLSDKLILASVFVFCYVARDLPLWIVILVIGRDLLILGLSAQWSRRWGHLPASILSGRLAALSLTLLATAYIFDLEQAKVPTLAVALLLWFISSVQYTMRLTQHAD